MKFVDNDDDDDTDIVNTTEIRPIYHAASLVVKNLALSLTGLEFYALPCSLITVQGISEQM